MSKEIDDRALPIDPEYFASILNRMKGVNDLWSGQETSITYLDFPDNFPVRKGNKELLGHLVWDEAETWHFQPATHEAAEKDEASRQPEPPRY